MFITVLIAAELLSIKIIKVYFFENAIVSSTLIVVIP